MATATQDGLSARIHLLDTFAKMSAITAPQPRWAQAWVPDGEERASSSLV